MVIDGPTLLDEALAAGLVVREVLAEASVDPALLARAEAAGALVRPVRDHVLAGAVDAVTPQGVASIAERRDASLGDAVAAAATGVLCLVLVDVGDPGNAGTLLRTAEAFGASAAVLTGATVDAWNPKCVRASAGAIFRIPIAVADDPLPVLAALADAAVPTVAAVARGGAPPTSLDLRGPVAPVLGSEAHGLAEPVAAVATSRVTIPMPGPTESLNVAMAGAVLCYESSRQRSQA